MWYVRQITQEYCRRICALLALHGQPLNRRESVVCVDEKGVQLLAHSRAPLPIAPGVPAGRDYETVRYGTANFLAAIEPRAGYREVSVTARRGKADFVTLVSWLVQGAYASARLVHLVLNNLNAYSWNCFEDVLGRAAAAWLLRRVRFECMPKRASWLNMAEIEIGILARQCPNRRQHQAAVLADEVVAWRHERNAQRKCIEWMFTRLDADRKLGPHCVPLSTD